MARELAVSVVIPAYNEAEAVGAVIEGVRGALSAVPHEIVVVDDGSTDATAEAAKKAGATVLRHPTNGGYGSALDTGVHAAKHDWILMIDADGSYPVSEIAALLPHAPDFDLIIGARTGVHFWGSPMQAVLRSVYLRIASFISGVKVPDANSGLRLVRKQCLLEKGPVECRGFSYSTTMTLTFLQSGRWVRFVPIKFDARVGKSKVRKLRDIVRTLQLMTMVMLAYNPLKLFVTLSLPWVVLSVAAGARYACHRGVASLIVCVVDAFIAVQCLIVGFLVYAVRISEPGAAKRLPG